MSEHFSTEKTQPATPPWEGQQMTTLAVTEAQYQKLASVCLTRAEYEVLKTLSFHPSKTIIELEMLCFSLGDKSVIPETVKALTKRATLNRYRSAYNLTRVGWVLLDAASMLIRGEA